MAELVATLPVEVVALVNCSTTQPIPLRLETRPLLSVPDLPDPQQMARLVIVLFLMPSPLSVVVAVVLVLPVLMVRAVVVVLDQMLRRERVELEPTATMVDLTMLTQIGLLVVVEVLVQLVPTLPVPQPAMVALV